MPPERQRVIVLGKDVNLIGALFLMKLMDGEEWMAGLTRYMVRTRLTPVSFAFTAAVRSRQ